MPISGIGAIDAQAFDRLATSTSSASASTRLRQIADLLHRGGIDLLCREEQPLRVVEPESRDIALQPRPVVVQTEARGRHEHVDAARADAEVAGEREIGRTAIDAAVQHGDRDRARLLERVDDAGEVDLSSTADAADVETAAEILAGAPQQQHEDVVARIHVGDQRAESNEVVGAEPVRLIRTAQGDGRDRAIDAKVGRCVGHRTWKLWRTAWESMFSMPSSMT
jgi:hypothetical protein